MVLNLKHVVLFITFVKKNLGCYFKDMVLSDSIYFFKTDYTLVSNLLFFFKTHTLFQFKFLFDVSASINYKKGHNSLLLNKFTIYYYLSSYMFNTKIIVYTQIPNEKFFLSSLCNLYKSSIWLEREV
jgi:NADH:ubiquinone oxidoreductase subunit C